MKDFFLLGRGELFLALVDIADNLMKQSPTPTTQHGLLFHMYVCSKCLMCSKDRLTIDTSISVVKCLNIISTYLCSLLLQLVQISM